MKKIKLLKATVSGGKAHKLGAVIDASDADAHFLVGRGKAEYVDAKKAASEKVKREKLTRGSD